MKIIHSGLLNKQGITYKCSCGCLFKIEDKRDWSATVVSDVVSGNKYVEYQCHCPECGYEVNFGIDHNEYNRNEEGFMVSNSLIFEREDWIEKYRLNVEEVL